jgi:hypothetical protein
VDVGERRDLAGRRVVGLVVDLAAEALHLAVGSEMALTWSKPNASRQRRLASTSTRQSEAKAA